MSPEPPGTSVAVAFCPHPPLLLRGPAGTSTVGDDRLRVACGDALQTVLGLSPDVVLVVGEGPAGVRYGPGDAADLARWGGAGQLAFAGRVRPGGRPLPLAHAVGARLLDEAGHSGTRLGVAPDDLADALAWLPGPVGVLAMGELPRVPAPSPGSARPATSTTGAAVAAAFAAGDPVALAGLAAPEGDRPTPAGVRTWAAVGRALDGRSVTARLLLHETRSGTRPGNRDETGDPAGRPAQDEAQDLAERAARDEAEDLAEEVLGHAAEYVVADWVLADVPDGVPGWMQP